MHPIELLRAHLGLSQAELGAALGRSQPTVSAWEARKRPIPSAVAIRLSRRYHRELADLGIDAGDLVLGRRRRPAPRNPDARGAA